MNSSAGKLRKPFCGIAMATSVFTFIVGIISIVITTNSGDYFGVVMATRIGAILTFVAAIIAGISAHIGGYPMKKAASAIVIASIMFILNFILAPISSKQSALNLYFSSASVNSKAGAVIGATVSLVAIVCLSIAMIIICAFCIAEKPKSNT